MRSVFVLFAVTFAVVQGLPNVYKDTGKLLSAPEGVDVGDPLILTEFLKNGSIAEGRQAALVQGPSFLNVTSYSGFFTVDDRYDSNLWFWFIPSAGNIAEDPVLLWLNGGPGSSSMNGMFDENGPYLIDENGTTSLREYSWHKNQSLIFVDNPVGVGFSFTDGGLAENETKVGEDMVNGLTQFFQLFPELSKNDFYLTGESYAGKYLPAIAYTILKTGSQINLQGILIGDGWVDPLNQLDYGPYVYNAGLVSAEVKAEIDQVRLDCIEQFYNGSMDTAIELEYKILDLIYSNSRVNIYNYLEEYDSSDRWVNFLSQEDTRRALHVGAIQFGDKGAGGALHYDELLSVVPWLEELLGHYRILIFNGQADIIVAYPTVLDFINKLNFPGVEEYRSSFRDIWWVDGEPAGYYRQGGNLTELLVRNSGHMVPRDQPEWGYDLMYRFTRNIPFYE